MNNILQKTFLFRWGGVFLAAMMLLMASINFYRYVTSPSDENLFINPPSHLAAICDIPASDNADSVWIPSVKKGDLLLEVAGKSVQTISEVNSLIEEMATDERLELTIIQPQFNRVKKVNLYRIQIPDSFLMYLPPVAYVIRVETGGASDRAGMRPGDMIYKIDGQTFQNSREADLIMQKARLDRSIIYEIFRENQPITLHVTLALAGIRFTQLIAFLIGSTYLLLGVFLLLIRSEYTAACYLGFSSIFFGFHLMTLTVFRAIGTGYFAALILLITSLSFFLSLVFWFRSFYYFPIEVENSSPRQSYERFLMWLAWTCGSLNYFILLGIYTNFKLFRLFGRFGYVSYLLLAIFMLFAIYGKIRFRKLFTPVYKKMHIYIKIAGILAGILIGFILILIRRNLSNFYLIPFVFLLFPAAYIYTIGKYSLMDLQIRVRRNIQYSILSLAWFILIFIIAGLILGTLSSANLSLPAFRFSTQFIEIIEGSPSPEQSRLIDRFFFLFTGGLIILTLWRVKRKGQQFISKKYYRSQYDYRLAANEMSQMLNTNLDMYQLARELANKLAFLMHLKRVGILFFRNQKECCCQEFHGFDGKEWTSYCIDAGESLVSSVQSFYDVTRIQKLPLALHPAFENAQFQYMIPIRSKDQLLGLILVGDKLSESAFQLDDYEFLRSVAVQAAVSIENAFLYEELREQERFKHELKIARQIQMSSLPQHTPQIRGLDIFGISLPAQEVGGDFFDYLNGNKDELMVLIGDVSGKGTSAALYMAKVQGIFRSLSTFNLLPKELFCRANRILNQDMDKTFFVTGLAGQFRIADRSLLMARAGHLPLYHYQAATGTVEIVKSSGIGFGLEASTIFDQQLTQVNLTYLVGDIFLFVTDGITEAFSPEQQEFGDDRLIAILKETAAQDANAIGRSIQDRIRDFRRTQPLHDDYTLVVVKSV